MLVISEKYKQTYFSHSTCNRLFLYSNVDKREMSGLVREGNGCIASLVSLYYLPPALKLDKARQAYFVAGFLVC